MYENRIFGAKFQIFENFKIFEAPVHREAHGVDRVMDLAKSYLFQTSAPVNYLFNDASSISYIARNRPFSSFLQTLSETLAMLPSLVVIHLLVSAV